MLTATKRGLVLTKSVNAFQDGIHRRTVKVSAKNQLHLMEFNKSSLVAQILPQNKTVSRFLIVQYLLLVNLFNFSLHQNGRQACLKNKVQIF